MVSPSTEPTSVTHPAQTAQSSSALTSNRPSYTLFESGQVRPLALSPDGRLLFATNTPDNRLEVFRVGSGGLDHVSSIPVGMEPVAVAARSNSEVWVVNHLSDSVSIVRIDDDGKGRVERTLLVGDEPRDIVFAQGRAFITTAHRGQNVPYDPQLTTPSIGRADVWVFDASHPGDSLTGHPITILTLFTDTPRALAVSPDGRRVYAAGFHSGNQTTAISALLNIIPGFPGPFANADGAPAPLVGSVAKFKNGHWTDSAGRDRDADVNFTLPDKDVFTIDATTNPPREVSGGVYTGVGTILFNMAVNPVNGHVYVSNLESFNDVRFEGTGAFAGETVRGHNVESRITVLANGTVTPRHLNKHIDYGHCCDDLPNTENAKSLAFPQSMAVSRDGKTLYVAALGSSKVGIFNTAQLEANTFTPSVSNHIPVTGGGPTGMVLDERNGRLYVLTRFDDSIAVIDTTRRKQVSRVEMHSPEPPSITRGRRFLYDASFSSSHGDQACAGCHIFGDFDSLAWDLGNPEDSVKPNDNPTTGSIAFPAPRSFHPMKGPMTTQSLRGMANQGPMHWRGDRTASSTEPNVPPDSGAFNERAAFKQFNPAFLSLIGRAAQIPDGDMEAFTDFILEVSYPPNPIRHFDKTLTAEQQAGSDFFFGPNSFREMPCGNCHVLDPAQGLFGTNGTMSDSDEPDLFKVPHLRNLYQKVGMFGMPQVPFGLINPIDNGFKGEQVRGVGFNHDGTFDTVFRFNNVQSFNPSAANPDGIPVDDAGMQVRRNLEAFMLAFDSELAPIVGQQATYRCDSGSDVTTRIHLMMARASLGECDLVAKTVKNGREAGFLYVGNGRFKTDRASFILEADLRELASHAPITYTCVPPGSGQRLGLDRDEDGVLDGVDD